MEIPLNVAGVGKGTKMCQWEFDVPMALQLIDGFAKVFHLVVPCVENDTRDMQDVAADLPIIIGTKSLNGNKALIEYNYDGKGNGSLTIPGPGGYTVKYEPGATHMKIEMAQSGHPMVACGEFDKVKAAVGVEPKIGTFHAIPKMETGAPAIPVTKTEIDEITDEQQLEYMLNRHPLEVLSHAKRQSIGLYAAAKEIVAQNAMNGKDQKIKAEMRADKSSDDGHHGTRALQQTEYQSVLSSGGGLDRNPPQFQ